MLYQQGIPMLSNSHVLIDALVLSVIGMLVVFVFLACLVGVLSLLQFVRGDDHEPSPMKTALKSDDITEKRKRAAAIAVSIHEFEQSR